MADFYASYPILGTSGGGGSGTVTSVDVSGGSTGLTTSGGPITDSGTITLAGTVNVAHGGTGDTTLTAYSVLCGGTTSTGALQQVSGVGTSGQALLSNGAAALPSWQDIGGGTGTVTSVAMTVPTFLSVSGSPITTSGTLGVTLSGTALPVANGGTGLTSGTSGGILGFTASGTIASSGDLTANAIVLGGGAGATPSVLGSLGTTTTVLHGNASGAPTFGAVSLTADVSGTLPVANGGTGDATLTAYSVLCGGTTSTGALQQVSGVGTSGQVLTSNGAAALPTWQDASGGAGTVTSVAMTVPTFLSVSGSPITTSGTLGVTLSGTALPVANGGTGLTSGTSGGILGFTASGTIASSGALTANALVLGGGAGATPSVLGSLGTTTTVLHGNASGAPTFGAVSLTADVSGTLPIGSGGTGQTSANAAFNALSPMTTAGDLIYENATPVGARLAIGSTGDVLTVSGGLPVWAPPATGGTVTSVAMTVPTFLSVSGSPITSSGTLGVTLSGTALPVANGGTGDTSLTAYAVLCGGTTTTGALQQVSGVGTSGQVLTSAGASALPTWVSPTTAVTTVGAFSGSSQTNGASISGATITFGPADGTNPGMVKASGSQTLGATLTLTNLLTTAGLATTKQAYFSETTLTDASSISWDLNANQATAVTLGGNRTLANPTNIQSGATYTLVVTQDGTGTRTLAYGSAYKWPGGTAPTLSTAAGAVDVLTFLAHGSNMLGVSQLAFS